jgi:DNA-binding GntR family transcriptional regulator
MTHAEAIEILRSRSLHGAVHDEIERLILAGSMAPGEPLREAELAQRLGVSRGPVREAFRSLEEKGLVTVVKHCGAHVRSVTPREAEDIFEVREILEAAIGDKVARVIDDEGLSRLSVLVVGMEGAAAAHDLDRYASLNLSFHDALALTSGNARLYDTYRRVVAELALLRRHAHARSPASLHASLVEHRAILQAVSARKPAEASWLLVRHTVRSRARLRAAFADERARSGSRTVATSEIGE